MVLELDLTCIKIKWYTKFQLNISKHVGEKCGQLWRTDGHHHTIIRPVWRQAYKNYSTGPKFKLNLRILMIHLYPEFQSKMSICNGDNEWKLKINGIFLSPRGITLPKINRPDPNSNSTCVFSWHIYIPNFNSKCQFVMEIMSGNWKLMEFF